MPFSYAVPMPDGSDYVVKRLLGKGDDNTKTAKSDAAGFRIKTVSLSLAPYNSSGYNVCASASPGCIKDCLYTSGLAGIFPRTILPPRIAKTILYKTKPGMFIDRLLTELGWANRLAARKSAKLFVRLNITSDIMFEREAPVIFDMFPNVQFYDYTAHYLRMFRFLNNDAFPANYHLTFSRKENNWDKCEKVLYAGGNVAVPFHVTRTKSLPRYWNGFPVKDGDVTDLRPLDPQNGYVIGLRAKGKARKDYSTGFIVDIGRLPIIGS